MLQSQTWYFTRDSQDLQKAARGWEAKRRTTESLLSDKAMLVLCAYPITAPRAADVTRTHQSIIKKRREESEAQ